jgi:hypothetical protein
MSDVATRQQTMTDAIVRYHHFFQHLTKTITQPQYNGDDTP